MQQTKFHGMPRRPYPVFEDVIPAVADRVTVLFAEHDRLDVDRDRARKEITDALRKASQIQEGRDLRSRFHKRCEAAVKFAKCIKHGPVGLFEMTLTFKAIILEELAKAKQKRDAWPNTKRHTTHGRLGS